jgi:hypothetical protein
MLRGILDKTGDAQQMACLFSQFSIRQGCLLGLSFRSILKGVPDDLFKSAEYRSRSAVLSLYASVKILIIFSPICFTVIGIPPSIKVKLPASSTGGLNAWREES